MAAVLILPLGACDEPADVTGEWRLTSIDSDPIPAPIEYVGADSTVILEGRLTLQPDRQFSMSALVEEQDGSSADTSGTGLIGDWSRSDEDVVIAYYGLLLPVLYRDTFHYERGRLVNYSGDTEYSYERSDEDE